MVLTVAMWMLSTLHVETGYWRIGLAAYVFGAGLGFTMQTIMVAVQNSVDFRDMGTATSAVTFFRSMGGAIGTAVFGAVLSNRLAQHLREVFAGAVASGQALPSGNATQNIQAIQALPEPVRGKVLLAFTEALHDVFLVGVPFVMLAFVVALFLKEIPLRTSTGAPAGPAGEPAPEPVVR